MRSSVNDIIDFDNNWLKRKLEELGVGFPYISSDSDSDDDSISHFFANLYPHCVNLWGEEKFEALIKHYAPDFVTLYKSELECMGCSLVSKYLDITSDIMVALHFACSEYHFLSEGETQESLEAEKAGDGVLFIFDLKEIEKAEFLKLVSYPSYSYFCKKETEDKLYFQSFTG